MSTRKKPKAEIPKLVITEPLVRAWLTYYLVEHLNFHASTEVERIDWEKDDHIVLHLDSDEAS